MKIQCKRIYLPAEDSDGKRVAISGAGGRAATANCRAKLTELLTLLKANVIEPQTGVALQPQCWASDVLELTDDDLEHLQEEADAILKD